MSRQQKMSLGEVKRQRPRRSGFTLIELLVVISVIAMLISILLPALAAARETAQQIQCSSKQRQIGLGLAVYIQEHDDTYPPAAYLPGVRPTWAQLVDDYMNIQPKDEPVPDTDASAMFNCPTMVSSLEPRILRYFTEYGYNYYRLGAQYNKNTNEWIVTSVSSTNLELATRADELARPSATMTTMDTRDFGRAPLIYGTYTVRPLSTGEPQTGDFRHKGSANVAYADGHAASQKVEYFQAPAGSTYDEVLRTEPWGFN